jgi:MFS family permease
LAEERADTITRRAGNYPTARRAWYAVAVLYFAYALVLADRQVLAFLVDPIREDLALSDFQFSLISGFFLVAIYSLLAIPLGRFADSHDRRDVIAASVAFWSLMTVLCSRASGLIVLLLARFGSGVSQAVMVPASVSLIADSFSTDRRPLAISVYASGAYVGIGLAHILSGFIVAMTTSAEGLILPLTGRFSSWQLAFVFLALPSILVLALMRRLNEPDRQGRARIQPEVRLHETIEYARRHWFVFTSLIMGAALAGIGMFAIFAWVPTIFSRVYDWSGAETGIVFGLVTIVFGTAGLVVGGIYAGRFIREGQKLVFQRLMMLSVACAIIPGAITMTADSAPGMWACFAAVIFFLAMPVGLAQTAIQAITPNKMRARLIATYFAALNIIGLGFGPIAVAVVTDFVFRDDAAIDRSIGVVIVSSGVASVLLLALSVKQYEEMDRSK